MSNVPEQGSGFEKRIFVYKFFPRYENPELILTQYGYHRWQESTIHSPTIKDSYVLHVLLDGSGWLRAKGKRYRIEKGCAFLLKPAELTSYYSDKTGLWSYVWIGVDGKDAANFFEKCGFTDSEYVVRLKNSSKFLSIIEQMAEHRSESGEEDLFLIGKMYEFLGCFQSNLLRFADKREGNRNDNLQRAVDYIHAHYYRDLSVTEICETLGFERSGLYRMFKKHFGISPQQYILRHRLETAQNYVTSTNMSLKTIALECGFNNYSYFYNSFCKYKGCAPKEFRERAEKTQRELDEKGESE